MGITSRSSHRGMPSKNKILKYWEENLDKLGPDMDGYYDIVEDSCWACNKHFTQIERCHIVPAVSGGSNKVSNLHLLCRSCHTESEGHVDYWNWFKYMRENEFKSFSSQINRILKIHKIDTEKEAAYLTSINASQKEWNNHVNKLVKGIFDKEVIEGESHVLSKDTKNNGL